MGAVASARPFEFNETFFEHTELGNECDEMCREPFASDSDLPGWSNPTVARFSRVLRNILMTLSGALDLSVAPEHVIVVM